MSIFLSVFTRKLTRRRITSAEKNLCSEQLETSENNICFFSYRRNITNTFKFSVVFSLKHQKSGPLLQIAHIQSNRWLNIMAKPLNNVII